MDIAIGMLKSSRWLLISAPQ